VQLLIGWTEHSSCLSTSSVKVWNKAQCSDTNQEISSTILPPQEQTMCSCNLSMVATSSSRTRTLHRFENAISCHTPLPHSDTCLTDRLFMKQYKKFQWSLTIFKQNSELKHISLPFSRTSERAVPGVLVCKSKSSVCCYLLTYTATKSALDILYTIIKKLCTHRNKYSQFYQ